MTRMGKASLAFITSHLSCTASDMSATPKDISHSHAHVSTYDTPTDHIHGRQNVIRRYVSRPCCTAPIICNIAINNIGFVVLEKYQYTPRHQGQTGNHYLLAKTNSQGHYYIFMQL
jgi:hypothetical protein